MAAEEWTTLLQTAEAFIDGYNRWEIEAIMAKRASDCTQKVYPARLKQPTMNNEKYRQYFMGVMPEFRDYSLNILEATQDAQKHRVVMYLSASAKTDIGDYANEFMVTCQMTEDDTQITEIKEFVDSGYAVNFFQRLRAHMATKNSNL